MAAITLTQGSATIGTTEYFLASDSTTATYQTTDCILQVYLDLGAMATGDEYLFKIYEKVDGTNAEVIYTCSFLGAQSQMFVTPAFIVGVGWEVSLDKIAGTDRAIPWTLAKIG